MYSVQSRDLELFRGTGYAEIKNLWSVFLAVLKKMVKKFLFYADDMKYS
jgi:hypothetical protein